MSATLVHQGKVFESKILTGVQSAIKESRVYDVALFLVSPFIGLAYAVALPFVGTGMILYQGWKALKSSNT